MIQIPYRCEHYTKNENMNKTCKGEKMCKIYYEEECREFKEIGNTENKSNKNN